jgi:hypothetical protein
MHLAYISVFGNRLSRKSNNNNNNFICYQHRSTTAVQTTLVVPVAIRSSPSQASFALRASSQVTDEAAYVIGGILSKIPSSRYLSESGSYPLDLSGLGDPVSSNATASLDLRVNGTHKPLHQKVVITSEDIYTGIYIHIYREIYRERSAAEMTWCFIYLTTEDFIPHAREMLR